MSLSQNATNVEQSGAPATHTAAKERYPKSENAIETEAKADYVFIRKTGFCEPINQRYAVSRSPGTATTKDQARKCAKTQPAKLKGRAASDASDRGRSIKQFIKQ